MHESQSTGHNICIDTPARSTSHLSADCVWHPAGSGRPLHTPVVVVVVVVVQALQRAGQLATTVGPQNKSEQSWSTNSRQPPSSNTPLQFARVVVVVAVVVVVVDVTMVVVGVDVSVVTKQRSRTPSSADSRSLFKIPAAASQPACVSKTTKLCSSSVHIAAGDWFRSGPNACSTTPFTPAATDSQSSAGFAKSRKSPEPASISSAASLKPTHRRSASWYCVAFGMNSDASVLVGDEGRVDGEEVLASSSLVVVAATVVTIVDSSALASVVVDAFVVVSGSVVVVVSAAVVVVVPVVVVVVVVPVVVTSCFVKLKSVSKSDTSGSLPTSDSRLHLWIPCLFVNT